MNEHQKLKLISNLSAETKKKPIIIELAGTPNSGKTTIINEIDTKFRRYHINCNVICETAKICKIHNKKKPEFNFWTALETIQKILSVVDQGNKIIICDRGIFDAIAWMKFHLNNHSINKKDYNTAVNFYLLDEWRQYNYFVNVITCQPAISMKRDIGFNSYEVHGSIINPEVLPQLNIAIEEARSEYNEYFVIHTFDTSSDIETAKKEIIAHILDTLIVYLQ